MDKRISQASGCDALNTTAQEAQCNVQMLPTTMNQPCYKSLKSPNCLNYYDDLFCASIEMKEEFPDDEYPQSSHIDNSGIDSTIVFDNEELSKVPEIQEIKQEVSDEALSFIKTEEIHDKEAKFIAKTEMSEESRILSYAGDTSVLYEVQSTPQIQPTVCGGILKNGFNLLTHNNEYIKIKSPTLVGNEGNKSHKCHCCDEHVNHDDIHSHKKQKSELYHESIKKIRAGTNVDGINYKCDLCKQTYKRKSALVSHLKKIHYRYGKIFECWCGKQFPTLVHLYQHKAKQHGANVKKTNVASLKKEFQCDVCKKMFKLKYSLKQHILSIHCDYGKTFECWCGKQFRTPLHLHKHKSRQHGTNAKSTNNATLKKEFQCDVCKKMFKLKYCLKQHILSFHYDYGKTFECWCGKQFPTSIHLYQHKYYWHGIVAKRTNDVALKKEFQCDICKKMFRYKANLKQHILMIHCDYGKTFECLCGKQFRTPRHLYKHKNQQHGASNKSTNNATLKKEFQCDVCKKMFKYKDNLKKHILCIHYDYDKIFECWCGKQFPTSVHLYQHNATQHDSNVQRTNVAALKTEFPCDICKKMFKYKDCLKKHISSVHYDYGKTFECWCGKQFRTPRYLYQHKNRVHDTKIKSTKSAAFKTEFQCDICKKMFKSKDCLRKHITNIHYDYGNTFNCWCGKQFRTPRYLYKHKCRQHGASVKITNNAGIKKNSTAMLTRKNRIVKEV